MILFFKRNYFFGSLFYDNGMTILATSFHGMSCGPWFTDPDRTVQSDLVNREPHTIVVLLELRTSQCKKSMKLLELWPDRTIL